MQKEYVTKLNKLFSNKKSLYAESSKMANDDDLSSIIIKLNELGYDFTSNDFDNFLICATYNKTNGYINNNRNQNRKMLMSIMFIKFTPNDKQFKLLMSCYKKSGMFDWVDILITKGFIFTDKQISELSKVGYNTIKIVKNSQIISIDQLKSAILSLTTYDNTELDVLRDLLLKVDLPTDFINWVLENLPLINYNKNAQIKKYKILMSILLEKLSFNSDSYEYIFRFISCDFVYFCVQEGFVPDERSLDYCTKKYELMELVLYFHKKFNLEVTTEMMNRMLKHKTIIAKEVDIHYHTNYISDVNTVKKMLLSFGYDEELIDGAVKNNHISLYSLLQLPPDNETFKLAIKDGYEHIFNDCIKTHKMVPNYEHMQTLFQSYVINSNIFNELLCYKLLPTKQDFKKLLTLRIQPDIVELLVNYGFILDLDDIAWCLKNNLIIYNLERFNIKYDENLYHICYKYNKFPYDDKFTLDKDIMELRKLCKNPRTTITHLSNFMQQGNVKMDRYCFDHICYCNHPLYTELMNKFNFTPTMTMYYWMGLCRCNFQNFDKYAETYGITVEYMSDKYEIDLTKN